MCPPPPFPALPGRWQMAAQGQMAMGGVGGAISIQVGVGLWATHVCVPPPHQNPGCEP